MTFLRVAFGTALLLTHLSETFAYQRPQTKEIRGKLLGCWAECKQVILHCLQAT